MLMVDPDDTAIIRLVGALILEQNANGRSPGDACHWKVLPGSSITLFSVCPAWATETITAAETACTNYTT